MAKSKTSAGTIPPFSSDASDGLAIRQEQLKGLASCLVILGGCKEGPDLLAEGAITQLGYVMRELAEDAERLHSKMWNQYTALRAAAEVAHG